MKHRRRIMLINKKFQLKFSFFVCSWALVLCMAFPLAIKETIDVFTRILSRRGDAATLQLINNFHTEMMTVTTLFMLIFIITVFLISIFLSHRIAGPVYRIQSALERWKRGTVEKNIVFRKYDHFEELSQAYNSAAEQFYSMKDQTLKASGRLKKIAEELEPKHRAQLQELIGELQCIAEKK